MQCGVPVITSNTTSLPEVVGDAGLMVEPNDGEALCEAMLRLLTDIKLRDELSSKALERCKSFSWTRCADDTVKVYQAAASEK